MLAGDHSPVDEDRLETVVTTMDHWIDDLQIKIEETKILCTALSEIL